MILIYQLQQRNHSPMNNEQTTSTNEQAHRLDNTDYLHQYTSFTEMSTNFKSISISITVNFVCSTVPDYEESIQTLIFTTSDNFEEWFKKNAFSHSKWVFKR